MPKDVYLQPDAPDPVLSDDVVLGLVRRHAPGAQAVVGVDESGGEARTYAIDDRIVLKTQRPHRLRPRTSLAKEAAFLRHLVAFPAIPVPRVIGYARQMHIEYLCMTRMPGAALSQQTITGSTRTDVLQALGQALRKIHSVPQEPLGASGLFPADRSTADLRARLAEAFDEVLAAIECAGAVWAIVLAPRAVVDAERQTITTLGTGVT